MRLPEQIARKVRETVFVPLEKEEKRKSSRNLPRRAGRRKQIAKQADLKRTKTGFGDRKAT